MTRDLSIDARRDTAGIRDGDSPVAIGVVDRAREPAGIDAARAERPAPWFLLAIAVLLLAPLRGAVGPIRDINDLHWHILLGQEVLAGTPVTQAGHGWSFAAVPDTWVSTQWLAEVLFARLEQWGGLQAMLLYRAVTMIIAIGVLAAVTLVRRPPRASVWVFAMGALALSLTVQERSQQLTILLAPLVGWWVERLWRDGRLPRLWIVLPVAVVWANFHGGWVLLPAGLGVAAVGRVIDHGWRDAVARNACLLAAATVLAACVSPAGWNNVFAIARFPSSTELISEWQPVSVWNLNSIPLTALAVTVIIAWARGRVRPSRGEVAVVLLFLVFGFIAWRNVTPAVLLLCPLVTGTLARALGEPDPALDRPPLARTTLVLGVLGALIALMVVTRQSPIEDPAVPQRLLAEIAAAPADQRVLDTFNLSGPILYFGGRPPHVTVAVDGRADRYGGDFIRRYNDTLQAREGWQAQVAELDPTAALIRKDEALSGVLVAERGWVVVDREGEYVLLHAPGAAGWPAG